MKICIIGAGVIGTTYAWQLTEGGHQVTLVVRLGKKGQLEREGVHLDGVDLRAKPPKPIDLVFHPHVVETIPSEETYDLVIVAVKRNQLDTVLPLLSTQTGQADILFFLNFWSGIEEIERFIRPARYLFGFPWLIGGWREGTTIHCTIFNYSIQGTMLGEKDGRITPRVQQIATALESAHLKPLIQQDILGWLQTHYVGYLGPVGAILKAGSARAFAGNRALVKDSILATRECLEVCRARGVNPKKFAPLNRNYWPLFLTVPIAGLQYRMKAIQEMLEGNIKQGMDEIVAQYEDVVSAGERLGVPMPIMQGLKPYFVAAKEKLALGVVVS